MQKMGIHRLQQRVAVSAIDDGVEFRPQMHLPAAGADREIGDVGCALGIDAVENPLISPIRSQRSGNAVKHAEVRIPEGITAGYRGLNGIIAVPGAELALRIDQAGRPRVIHRGPERHRLAQAGRVQRQLIQLEHQRFFSFFFRHYFEDCAVRVDFIDHENRYGRAIAG